MWDLGSEAAVATRYGPIGQGTLSQPGSIFLWVFRGRKEQTEPTNKQQD